MDITMDIEKDVYFNDVQFIRCCRCQQTDTWYPDDQLPEDQPNGFLTVHVALFYDELEPDNGQVNVITYNLCSYHKIW